jgi:hypothetical protein
MMNVELFRRQRNEPTLGTWGRFGPEVTVLTAWIDIGGFTHDAAGGNLGFLIENTGAAALTNCRLLWRPTPSAAWQVLVDDSAAAWAAADVFYSPVAPRACAAGVTYTDLVVVSANTVTSATFNSNAGFAAIDIGRQFKITTGTGFNTGWYKIVDVTAAGVATVECSDKNLVTPLAVVGAVGSTGGTFIMPGVSCVEISAVGYEFKLQAKSGSSTTVRVEWEGSLAHLDMRSVASAADSANLAALAGAAPGLTYTQVKIDQTAAAGVTVLIAALASNYTRLHLLFGTMAVAGTLTIEDSDGTDLSGPMPVAATGGFGPAPTPQLNLCLKTAVGKGLSINTSQKFYGYAIVSQATS